jgi:hypothetical protein
VRKRRSDEGGLRRDKIHHGEAKLVQNRDEGGPLTLRQRLGRLGTVRGGSGWLDVEGLRQRQTPTCEGKRLSAGWAEELRKGETTTVPCAPSSGEAHCGQSAGRSPAATAERRSDSEGKRHYGWVSVMAGERECGAGAS